MKGLLHANSLDVTDLDTFEVKGGASCDQRYWIKELDLYQGDRECIDR